MSNIDKQWLQQKISDMEATRDEIPFGLDEDDSNTLAALRIALASLEAEAVAYIIQDADARSRGEKGILRYFANISDEDINEYEITVTPLYTAPPAPVSVPDLTALDKLAGEMLTHSMNCERRVAVAYTHCAHRLAEEVRDLRAAMLQGAENAESRCTIQAAPVLDSSPKNAESRCSNSPVIPDEKGSSLQLRNLIRQRHAEWSQATFGDVGPAGPLKHLSKEALEAAAEPEDLSEWADMQFLLWDAQRRAGISDGEITAAMEEKLKVNVARQWPEPKDGEPRLHIKAAPQQEVTQALAKGMERYGDATQELAKKEVKP
jgi:hypothetical protein